VGVVVLVGSFFMEDISQCNHRMKLGSARRVLVHKEGKCSHNVRFCERLV